MARRTHQVVYERDQEGYWVAEIPEIPQCYAQGRSLAAAKRKIREVLVFLKGRRFAREAQLIDTVHLGDKLEEKLREVSEEAERVQAQIRALEKERLRLIRSLTRLRYSNRDVGELLGVSHQRVAQLLSKS